MRLCMSMSRRTRPWKGRTARDRGRVPRPGPIRIGSNSTATRSRRCLSRHKGGCYFSCVFESSIVKRGDSPACEDADMIPTTAPTSKQKPRSNDTRTKAKFAGSCFKKNGKASSHANQMNPPRPISSTPTARTNCDFVRCWFWRSFVQIGLRTGIPNIRAIQGATKRNHRIAASSAAKLSSCLPIRVAISA